MHSPHMRTMEVALLHRSMLPRMQRKIRVSKGSPVSLFRTSCRSFKLFSADHEGGSVPAYQWVAVTGRYELSRYLSEVRGVKV